MVLFGFVSEWIVEDVLGLGFGSRSSTVRSTALLAIAALAGVFLISEL